MPASLAGFAFVHQHWQRPDCAGRQACWHWRLQEAPGVNSITAWNNTLALWQLMMLWAACQPQDQIYA